MRNQTDEQVVGEKTGFPGCTWVAVLTGFPPYLIRHVARAGAQGKIPLRVCGTQNKYIKSELAPKRFAGGTDMEAREPLGEFWAAFGHRWR